MCHGIIEEETNEFYLQFETRNADMFKCSVEKLRERLIGEDLSDIKLVFLNACYSEKIAEVFIKLGVNCVIGVNSQMQIGEFCAQNISYKFYEELLQGKSILNAWNSAKHWIRINYKEETCTCCCSHNHEENCKWKKYAKKNSKE